MYPAALYKTFNDDKKNLKTKEKLGYISFVIV
jgi:hypothetical protein